MAGIGAGELVVLAIIVGMIFLGYVPGIWATYDAAMQPDSAWRKADQDKRVWVLLPLISMFVCAGITPIAAAVYFLSVRPKVRAQRDPD